MESESLDRGQAIMLLRYPCRCQESGAGFHLQTYCNADVQSCERNLGYTNDGPANRDEFFLSA